MERNVMMFQNPLYLRMKILSVWIIDDQIFISIFSSLKFTKFMVDYKRSEICKTIISGGIQEPSDDKVSNFFIKDYNK